MSATAELSNGKPQDAAGAVEAATTAAQYPKATLQDSIAVAQAIERANGGNPYPPTETAIAMGVKPTSSSYRTLLSASSRRGLTSGAHTSKRITILDTGRDIVAPRDEDSRRAAIVKAALTPELFGRVYDTYRGKQMPAEEYFYNTLSRDFGVPQSDTARCSKIFRADMEYAGLLMTDPRTGVAYLSSDPNLAVPGIEEVEDDAPDEIQAGSLGATAPEVPPTVPPAAPLTAHEPERPKAIFIGHGPNKAPLNQLTKILDEYGLPYKVAEYEANAGRPISQKVADLMGECGAAILIFTADRELRDLEGNPVWLSSGNVAHELGAASVTYDGRVVIFKEAGVDLASNFSGIGYIEFEKDKLSAHGIELFRELVHFKLVKISVGQ